MRKLQPPSPAMVVAVIALILGLTGAAFGALQVVGKGDIRTKFLANNAVKAKKLADNAVKNAKIRGEAVTTEKIANNAVTSAKVADGAITGPKIANAAITGEKHFLSSVTNQNFGNIAGEACASLNIPAPGITANDHVLVTPPPGFPDTFTITGKPEPSGNVVTVAACNHFPGGGSVDPDGPTGAPYKVLVIRPT
jgi:hypothetical protein